MKIMSTAFLLSLLLCVPALAQDSRDTGMDTAREDYRAYLRQLKELGRQYNEVTAEVKKVIQEEGVPVWNDTSGTLEVSRTPLYSQGGQVTESQDEMTVSMDLPGLRKDSIRAVIREGRTLHVSGVRKNDPDRVLIERDVLLPSFALEKGSKAVYEDGVLTVRVRKAQPGPKDIPVPVS